MRRIFSRLPASRLRGKLPRITHQGYTRLVRTLRIALPVTALLMMGGVFLWPHFDPMQAALKHAAADAPEMNHSHFAGVDKKNRPFTVTADKAVQKSADNNDVDLTNPLAEVTMKSGTWVAVQADQGQYREDPGRIDLEGDVHMYHDQGYEMTTSAASLDLDEGIAWGTQPTEVHGPRADINAQGFKMLQDENEIIFTGPSRLVLKPEPEEAAITPDDAAAPATTGTP
jgi:lipopolysaccharide export system protein LptC